MTNKLNRVLGAAAILMLLLSTAPIISHTSAQEYIVQNGVSQKTDAGSFPGLLEQNDNSKTISKDINCGVQFSDTLESGKTHTWFTHSWPEDLTVLWTAMPVSITPDGDQTKWEVKIGRQSEDYVTYFITVTNVSSAPVHFEGRYCILK